MKNVLIFILLIPTYACSSSIQTQSYISTKDDYYNNKEDSSITSTVTIDLDKHFQNINNQFYGSHLDSYSELPSKESVDELQLGRLRVGGNEFDVYNWDLCKMISPQGEIKDAPCIESLAGQISKYKIDGIFQVNLSGIQPVFKNGVYVAERSFTPDSAYEMIKNFNGTKKLNIKNVSLGNEFSVWNETHSQVWGSEDAIKADDYIERYIKYAIAVRKAQEEVTGDANSIKIWGPEMTSSWYDWNTGNFSHDCKWTDIKGQIKCSYGNGKFDNFIPYFLSKIKAAEGDKTINPKKYKLLDYFSIHYYPNFRTKISDPDSIIRDSSGNQMVAEMLDSTRVWNDPTFINKYDITSYRNKNPNILNRFKGWLDQYYPNAKLTINEYAVDSDYRSLGYHPVVRPLILADSIGIFAKEGVAYMNHFDLSTPSNSTLPWSLIEGGIRTNLFHLYKLFTNNFKGTVVEATDNVGFDLNAYATVENNKINVAIVNKSPLSRKLKMYVKNKSSKKYLNYEVPGWSAAILKLDTVANAPNSKFIIQEFGAKEMGLTPDPSVQNKSIRPVTDTGAVANK